MKRATLAITLIFCYFGYTAARTQIIKVLSAQLALASADQKEAPPRKGGLWIKGNTFEALARLRWIAGEEADLISLSRDGKVSVKDRLPERAHHVIQESFESIEPDSANEGLLLLIQLTQSQYNYCLHIGPTAPTRGGAITVRGFINLEQNFDSRINPRRRNSRKLDRELPPEGFDAMIGINPDARLFNFCSREFVPAGLIVFHELAESHAKLELKLQYLSHDSQPGAHDVALDREKIFRSQRPHLRLVTTAGVNQLLLTESQIREFYLSRAFAESRKQPCGQSSTIEPVIRESQPR